MWIRHALTPEVQIKVVDEEVEDDEEASDFRWLHALVVSDEIGLVKFVYSRARAPREEIAAIGSSLWSTHRAVGRGPP